ncbi:leucine-rich repeat-containing protein 27-like [Rousettus aegyptiacus]|uniref:leucine-rich repeat-containing protein 27-like n=1 Tax=Rousettus aegyptiacus TaxID=9407 RepID=UPI00168D8597|nr:leucine-rich repeat-containing protein 27-like [Rousettus aegyptiacus]
MATIHKEGAGSDCPVALEASAGGASRPDAPGAAPREAPRVRRLRRGGRPTDEDLAADSGDPVSPARGGGAAREAATPVRRRAGGGAARRRRTPVGSRAPFSTDPADDEKTPVNPPGKPRQGKEQAWPARGERSVFRGGELDEKVRQTHAQRKRLRGVAPLEGIRKAAEDLESARGQQDDLTTLKSAPALGRSRRLPALAGSRPARPPGGQSRDTFFNRKH